MGRHSRTSYRAGKFSLTTKLTLIIACFFWAISFIATKVSLEYVPPLTVVTLRLVISALCFILFFFVKQSTKPVQIKPWFWRLVVLSLFGTGLHYGTQTIGIGYTSASNASLYAVTGPISIAIIAAVFLKEKISLKKGIGISLALAGVLTVMGPDTLRSFSISSHFLGDLLVFVSILMWAVFTVLSKETAKNIKPLELTGIVTVIGALYMLPVGIFELKARAFDLLTIPVKAWLAIAFLGITCSFLATLLYVIALEKSESQKVGVYLYTIPPMTYLAAALILKETIGLNLIIGSVIVFTGVYLTERG